MPSGAPASLAPASSCSRLPWPSCRPALLYCCRSDAPSRRCASRRNPRVPRPVSLPVRCRRMAWPTHCAVLPPLRTMPPREAAKPERPPSRSCSPRVRTGRPGCGPPGGAVREAIVREASTLRHTPRYTLIDARATGDRANCAVGELVGGCRGVSSTERDVNCAVQRVGGARPFPDEKFPCKHLVQRPWPSLQCPALGPGARRASGRPT